MGEKKTRKTLVEKISARFKAAEKEGKVVDNEFLLKRLEKLVNRGLAERKGAGWEVVVQGSVDHVYHEMQAVWVMVSGPEAYVLVKDDNTRRDPAPFIHLAERLALKLEDVERDTRIKKGRSKV